MEEEVQYIREWKNTDSHKGMVKKDKRRVYQKINNYQYNLQNTELNYPTTCINQMLVYH